MTGFQTPMSDHVVMLNLFQHLSFQHPLFQCINREIPKQVRNDSGKGSPEGLPSDGGLGVSPSSILPPLLKERGLGGEVNKSWRNT